MQKTFFLGGSTVGTILAYGWRDSERWFVKAKSSSDQRDNDIFRWRPFSVDFHMNHINKNSKSWGWNRFLKKIFRRLKSNSNSGCRKRINQTTHSANGQLFCMFLGDYILFSVKKNHGEATSILIFGWIKIPPETKTSLPRLWIACPNV